MEFLATPRNAIYFLLFILIIRNSSVLGIDGGWAPWSEWSGYGQGLCSGNQRIRTRGCTQPKPSLNGTYCIGKNTERQHIPVDGQWSDWSEWSTCLRPCGGSIVRRNRTCNNPITEHGGKYCIGRQTETKHECLTKCGDQKIDGHWSPWSDWSSCPVKCLSGGGAIVTRWRECDMPSPTNGGAQCIGNKTDSTIACFHPCPRDGGFGFWSQWSGCSHTCGSGKQIRKRFCNNPEPSLNGKNCSGEYTSIKHCKIENCKGKVNGHWSKWTDWSPCTVESDCKNKKKIRLRYCSDPKPLHGGEDCKGISFEKQKCPSTNCTDSQTTVVATFGKGYIATECSAMKKYKVKTTKGLDVPNGILRHIKLNLTSILNGYYAVRKEEESTVLKYCFEPHPKLTSKDAKAMVNSYSRVMPLTGQKDLDPNDVIMGFALRVYNTINYTLKGYEIGLYDTPLYYPGNGYELHDVIFKHYSEQSFAGKFAVGSYHRFKPRMFRCLVYNNQTLLGKQQILDCNTENLTVQEIFNKSKVELPNKIKDILRRLGLLNLTLKTVKLNYIFRKEALSPTTLTAKADVSGIPVDITVTYISNLFETKFAIGFLFHGSTFSAIISKSTDMDNPMAPFLDSMASNLEVSVSYSPSYFEGTAVKGMYATAKLAIPSQCNGNTLCKLIKRLVGPSVNSQMTASIQKGFYKITAGFHQIQLAGHVQLSKFELFFQASENDDSSKTRTVGFHIEIKIPVTQGQIISDGMIQTNDLYFGGLISHAIGSSNISATLYMKGSWRNAFGLEWLTMKNILVGFMVSKYIPVPGFELGGTVEFGYNCLYDKDFANEGNCLRFKVYFGVYGKNYFYGSVTELTMGKLIRMTGATVSLPEPIKEAGFPAGLQVSYALDITYLTKFGGPIIFPGFRLKGNLNLIGYQFRAQIHYSPKEILMDAECDPINLGGHAVLSRGKHQTSLGPKLYFFYRLTSFKIPYVKAYLEGYSNIFGIEGSTALNFTTEAFELSQYGKIWNLMYSHVFISASYDVNQIQKAHFYARVKVDLNGLSQVTSIVIDQLNKQFEYARNSLRNAISKVKAEKQNCISQMQLKCDKCQLLKCRELEENCKESIDDVKNWIGVEFNRADRSFKQTDEESSKKYQNSFYVGLRRRRNLHHSLDNDFDHHHVRNRRFISQLICKEILGDTCKGVRKMCSASCSSLNYISRGICHSMDVAVGVLKLVESVTQWIKAAAVFILNIFHLHSISYEIGLGRQLSSDFKISANIDMTLYGQRMNFGFALELIDPTKSIASAVEKALHEYKEGIQQERKDTIYNPYDELNPNSDFELSGHFGIEALQTKIGERSGACLAVTTTKIGERIRQMACNEADTRQKWSYTINGNLKNKFSGKCMDLPSYKNGFAIQKKCNPTSNSQRLQCDVETKSIKIRKKNLCLSTGLSSPSGNGSIAEIGSNQCIHVTTNNTLVLKDTCSNSNNEFYVDQRRYIIHLQSGQCVRHVVSNHPNKHQSSLELHSKDCHKFSFTKFGSIRHIDSKLCLSRDKNNSTIEGGIVLALGASCSNASSVLANSNSSMLFTFLPTNPYLIAEECGGFYDATANLKFAVYNDELASVCSKYPQNFALRRVTSQSSTSMNGISRRGVDGNFDRRWYQGSCTLTNKEKNPWWKVDLGSEQIVTDVTIIKQHQHTQSVEIHIGNHPDLVRNPICYDPISNQLGNGILNVQCNPPIPGRVVSVHVRGYDSLSLCEVIVNSRVGGISDKCLLDNGGCDQVCHSQCNGHVTCGCNDGYTLSYDGYSCLDNDECRVNNGGCRNDQHARCVNYPGGYYCACDAGYILKDNSSTECIDKNECDKRNGGCEQMCNNTVGGYLCKCRHGYERKKNDTYGCQDINECLEGNGGCGQRCINFVGGHYCSCDSGYKLESDGKMCEEITCRPLELPSKTIIHPNNCKSRFGGIPSGSNCTVACSKGYEIVKYQNETGVNEITISCGVDGSWNATTPSCKPVTCPPLLRPLNGGITPPSCYAHDGILPMYSHRCVAYCYDGYRLRGNVNRYCQDDRSWSVQEPFECVRVYDPPYLTCPPDIIIDLPSNKSSMMFGVSYVPPQTNLNLTSSKPKNVGPSFEFPSGITVVEYEAQSKTGEVLKCRYYVTVNDVTPPTVTNCPSDITIETSKTFTIIKWQEPHFNDTVGVSTIQRPHIDNGVSWVIGSTVNLLYNAFDEAGNQATCAFRVTIKSDKCGQLTGDGNSVIQVQTPNRYYLVHCSSNRVFFGAYGKVGGSAICKGNAYQFNGKDIGNKLPPCVESLTIKSGDICPLGKQKFVYDAWFFKDYYCASCPRGTRYQTKSRQCEDCPLGQFQSQEGQMECELCPPYYTTAKKASKELSDCIKMCPAGSYSSTGLNTTESPCVACPRHTFTSERGSTFCTPCKRGSKTKTEGAASKDLCLRHPKIEKVDILGNATHRIGNTIVVDCYTSGEPIPKSYWRKSSIKGMGISHKYYSTIYNIDLKAVGTRLKLKNVTRAERGLYQCIAINAAGSSNKEIEIKID